MKALVLVKGALAGLSQNRTFDVDLAYAKVHLKEAIGDLMKYSLLLEALDFAWLTDEWIDSKSADYSYIRLFFIREKAWNRVKRRHKKIQEQRNEIQQD